MSEQQPDQPAATTPGALIGAARRRQGLHIVALAAQLKVSPARLEALEADRWAELPDPTHARALATSVCRVLGMDAGPVLAGMPRGAGAALERVSAGLNQPVRDGERWLAPGGLRWVLLLVLLLLALAAALRWWPAAQTETQLVELPQPATEPGLQAPALPTSAASEMLQPELPASQVQAVSAPASVATAVPLAASASEPAQVAAVDALLQIHAESGASWVSVSDVGGQRVLASRLLQAGERLDLQPQGAVRVILGNAPAVRLSWRGQPQSLQAYESTRVAKLELK